MFDISNAEYAILALIQQQGAASGYQLNTILEERGYRQWADVGMTSIYTGLKKLEQKGLIEGQLTTNKTTQGPPARVFSLTSQGLTLLIAETSRGLSETRERDNRFDLALSSMVVLPSERARELVTERMDYLKTERERIIKVCERQRHSISPLGLLLFKHTLNFLESEIAFLKNLVCNWEEETAFDH